MIAYQLKCEGEGSIGERIRFYSRDIYLDREKALEAIPGWIESLYEQEMEDGTPHLFFMTAHQPDGIKLIELNIIGLERGANGNKQRA